MKIAVFSCKSYDKHALTEWNKGKHELQFFSERLYEGTVSLAKNFAGISIFINDKADAGVLERLSEGGTKVILLRASGYDNVDVSKAAELGIKVYAVAAYSPNAVAEHAVGLMLTLDRKIHKAYNRVREQNFSIEGLMGFNINGKTVGIMGTGAIGAVLAKITHGFGCKLLGYDRVQNKDLVKNYGLHYVGLDQLLAQSDIISIHLPLIESTKYIIRDKTIDKMKDGVMLINTSRGALVDTDAVLKGLKKKKIGSVGLDVYEGEQGIFFEDLENDVIVDDRLRKLLMYPNVIVTPHQAWFTREALDEIVRTTFENLEAFEKRLETKNEITRENPEKSTKQAS